MTAACSGGLGDIIYSIPVLRELNVDLIYIKESYYFPPYGSLYTSIKRLMEYEGFAVMPTNGAYGAMKYDPNLIFDYDIDRFRLMPGRGKIFIQANMRRYFKLRQKGYQPWLKMQTSDGGYTIIHLTDRWRRGSRVDWKIILSDLRVKGEKLFFTGFQYEWLDFCTRYGDIEWFPTNDVLEMCALVAGANKVYCNQSVCLTLAQGLGKNYYLEVNPFKTNCLIKSPNEHIL